MAKSKINLVLASASPRRKELLEHLKIPFEIFSLNVIEESVETDPAKFSLEIAQKKGEAVLHHLMAERPWQNILVVSADTIVCLGNKIYGKPQDREEARQFLAELSGKTHSVYTAVAARFLYEGQEDSLSFVDESKVTFENISNELMVKYLDTKDSLDKAGAYGIQGPSLTFISKVDGSYSNVVGFPLSRFVVELEKFLKHKFPLEKSWFDLF